MMKKWFLLLFLTGICWSSSGQGVQFEKGSFAEALEKVRKQADGRKLLFVDVFTSSCGPCVQVNTKIFPTKEAGDFFNEHFVNLKINLLEGEGPEFGKKYKVKAVPTFLVIDADGNEINRFVGGVKDAGTFILLTKKAMVPENSLRELKAAYERNKCFETGLPYLQMLFRHVQPEEKDVITEMFWAGSDEERYNPEFFRMLSRNTTFGDAIFQEILLNKATANRLLGDDKVENYFTSRAYMHVVEKQYDSTALAESIALLGAIGLSPRHDTYSLLRIIQLKQQGDIDGVIDYFEKWFSPQMKTYGFELSDLYGQASDEQKARIRRYFEKAIETSRNTTQMYENLLQRSINPENE